MKSYLLVVVAILLLVFPVNASIVNWTNEISINDDGGTDWTVALTYSNATEKSDYFVLSRVTNIEVYADSGRVDCNVTQERGTSIVCNGLSANEVVYKFHVRNLVSNVEDWKVFRYYFPVTQPVERMQVIVKFPLSAALVEESKLSGTGLRPFEPDFGRQGSDGRRIFVSWTFDKPALGQTIHVAAIYEILSGFDQFTLFAVILTLVVAGFLAGLVFFFRKHRVRDILPVLTEGERKVMEILLREKEVDQRLIVKETDFSKPKVSRIIHDLAARGLVEKVSRGRKNLIKLKKEVKSPESKSAKQEK